MGHQRNAIKKVFRWRVNDGPLFKCYLEYPLTKLTGSAHDLGFQSPSLSFRRTISGNHTLVWMLELGVRTVYQVCTYFSHSSSKGILCLFIRPDTADYFVFHTFQVIVMLNIT